MDDSNSQLEACPNVVAEDLRLADQSPTDIHPEYPVDSALPVTEEPPKRTISEAKLRANAENAKKSTGPKTDRGKRYSSFNATKHGLLARKVMFSADGKPNDEGLQEFAESLRHEFCDGGVVPEILTELLITDYWRLQRSLEFETKYLKSDGCQFHPQGGMPTLLRYLSANRRAFEKSLQTLMEMREDQPQVGKECLEPDKDGDE